MMLQQDEPDDYVIATGETHTIREFLDVAFRIAGYDDWEPFVHHDPRFDRPAEVDLLMGDATKAREKLGWEPQGRLRGARALMYESDLAEESAPRQAGQLTSRPWPRRLAARRRDHGQRLRSARDAGRARRARRVRRAARGARRVRAPHARRDVRVRTHAPPTRGLRVIIAGAGGAAHLPGHDRVAHTAAGDRRARAPRSSSTGSTRCCRSCRCRTASRWRPSAWARPATPGCSRSASSARTTTACARAWRSSRRARGDRAREGRQAPRGLAGHSRL